jgi:4-oxalomesaconate tautomerase
MKSRQTSIACSVIRGGTSRGAYFLSTDLPTNAELRDQVLTAVMGGPDSLQVDGLGGGHSLTSKVAIVGPSSENDVDVDYLFLQVAPDNSFVSAAQNCGNILSGVAPFAIEQGLVQAEDETTTIRVNMVNSGNRCELTLATPGGAVEYSGDTAIDGVPGTSSAIICDFLDIAGSVSGAMLPTGNVINDIGGFEVTCIDNGMPVVCARASDFGLSGSELPHDLDANTTLKASLEAIRLKAGPMMSLGDVSEKSVPKMCLVAEPTAGGHVLTRTFIPHECHRSIGVLGAVTVATACLLPGSVVDGVSTVPAGCDKTFSVEHPSGVFQVRLTIDEEAAPEASVVKAGVIRTARTLMRGEVFIPLNIWNGE